MGSTPDSGTNTKVKEQASAAPAAAAHRRCVLLHAPGTQVPGALTAGLGRQMGRLTVFSDAYAAAAELLAHEQARRGTMSGHPEAAAVSPQERVCLVIVDPARVTESAELVEALHRHAPGVPCWWYGRAAGTTADAQPDLHPVGRAVLESWALTRPSASPVPSAPSAPTSRPFDAASQEPAAVPAGTSEGGPTTLARIGPPADRWPVFGYDADTGTMEGVPRTPQLRLTGDPGTDPRVSAPVAPQPLDGGPGGREESPAIDPHAMALTEEELAVLLGDELPSGPAYPPPAAPRGGA